MPENVYEGLNARPKVYLSKEYYCKMYPTCMSSKLCEFISFGTHHQSDEDTWHGLYFPKVHFRCKAFASVFFSVFQSFYFCAVVVLPYFCLSSKISPKTGWKRAPRFPLFPTMRVDVKIKLILFQIFLKTKMVESLK